MWWKYEVWQVKYVTEGDKIVIRNDKLAIEMCRTTHTNKNGDFLEIKISIDIHTCNAKYFCLFKYIFIFGTGMLTEIFEREIMQKD